MGKLGQPAAAKPKVSERAATCSTKSCAYTNCPCSTCTHTSSYYTCTFFFHFIGGVGQNDDTLEYAIPAGD